MLRREFLQSSAAIAAASTLSSPISAAESVLP